MTVFDELTHMHSLKTGGFKSNVRAKLKSVLKLRI